MSRITRFLVAGLLGGLILTAQPASAAPGLSTLNVRLSDLPKGSKLFTDDTMNAAQAEKADKKPAHSYERLGVDLVNERAFNVAAPGASAFLLTEVVRVSSVTSATAFYAFQVQQAVKSSVGAIPFSFEHLGDQRFALGTPRSKGAQGTLVVLRQGRYLLEQVCYGPGAWCTWAQAQRLITLVDTRLKVAEH
jgi:hypothetical protein